MDGRDRVLSEVGGARPLEELASLDRVVHEPARLAILTALSACRSADFPFLARLTGLTHGNLSSHLTKLEAAGLLRLQKGYRGRTPTTSAALTDAGRAAITSHWERLGELRDRSLRLVADTSTEPL